MYYIRLYPSIYQHIYKYKHQFFIYKYLSKYTTIFTTTCKTLNHFGKQSSQPLWRYFCDIEFQFTFNETYLDQVDILIQTLKFLAYYKMDFLWLDVFFGGFWNIFHRSTNGPAGQKKLKFLTNFPIWNKITNVSIFHIVVHFSWHETKKQVVSFFFIPNSTFLSAQI